MDAVESIKRSSRPRKRPAKLHADKGYDFPRCRKALRERGIKGRIARRERTPARGWGGTAVGGGADACLARARCRRLSVRYERRADIHEAFLYLGCSLICLNYLS